MPVNVTLNNIANLQSTTAAQNTINNNNAATSTAFGSCFNVAGDTLLGFVNANSQQIFNLPSPATPTSPVRLIDLTNTLNLPTFNGAPIIGTSFTPTFNVSVSSVTGTNTGAVSLGGINTFNISSENVSWGSGIGLCNISSFYNFGSGGGNGTRYGLLSNLIMQGSTQNTAPNNTYYIGVAGNVAAQFNAGGSGTSNNTAVGVVQGGNFIGSLSSTATNYYQVTGAEIDVAAKAGTSVYRKEGLLVCQLTGDSVAGTSTDAGIVIANQSSTKGWSVGLQFGNVAGTALATTGTLIKGQGVNGSTPWATIGNGIDLSGFTITGNAYISPGFSVTNSGIVFAQGSSPAQTGGGGIALALGGSTNLGIYFGSSVPTISAATGAMYLRTDGNTSSTRMYICTGGSSWTSVITVA